MYIYYIKEESIYEKYLQISRDYEELDKMNVIEPGNNI